MISLGRRGFRVQGYLRLYNISSSCLFGTLGLIFATFKLEFSGPHVSPLFIFMCVLCSLAERCVGGLVGLGLGICRIWVIPMMREAGLERLVRLVSKSLFQNPKP